MNKLTLSVGIPAFNEAKNIKTLIRNLLLQSKDNYILEKIIVVSDGSIDNTVEEVNSIKDIRIELAKNSKRMGKDYSQNLILNKSNSDVLLIVDADIVPKDNLFIQNIVQKFMEKESTGLVCVKVMPAKSIGLISKALAHSQLIKLEMGEKIFGQTPVYMCNGRAMAYSKKLYKHLKFPKEIVADDAYACLSCLRLGMKVDYQSKSVLLYKVPGNMTDHIKQSTRFFFGKKQLELEFGEEYIRNSYLIPKRVILESMLSGFLKTPILNIVYIFILIISKAMTYTKISNNNYLWSVSNSTKGNIL